MKRDDVYLGIDVGGTKTAAGLVSCDGTVLARMTTPTPKAGSEWFTSLRSIVVILGRAA